MSEKPTASITSLHGAAVTNERRAHFLTHTAASFDRYVEGLGYEPDALMIVMGGLKQTARPTWTVCGDSEGGPTTMLLLAAGAFTKEAIS